MRRPIARHVSAREPVPRKISVSAVRMMSLTASTTAATATPRRRRPKDPEDPITRAAETPARPAPRARVKVQIVHRVYGVPKSVRSAAPATSIPAYGPKTIAANRIGRADTDIWRCGAICTLWRSARNAIPARPATAHGEPPRAVPAKARTPVSAPTAPTSANAYHCNGPHCQAIEGQAIRPEAKLQKAP